MTSDRRGIHRSEKKDAEKHNYNGEIDLTMLKQTSMHHKSSLESK